MLIVRQLQRRRDRSSPVRMRAAHGASPNDARCRRRSGCVVRASTRRGLFVAKIITGASPIAPNCNNDTARARVRPPLRCAMQSVSNLAGPRPTATDVSRGLEYCRARTTTRYSARSYEDTCRAVIRPFSPACCAPLPLGSRCWAVCRVAAHFEDLDLRKPPPQFLSARVRRRCCEENTADHARAE